jgi:hypothetical protein
VITRRTGLYDSITHALSTALSRPGSVQDTQYGEDLQPVTDRLCFGRKINYLGDWI